MNIDRTSSKKSVSMSSLSPRVEKSPAQKYQALTAKSVDTVSSDIPKFGLEALLRPPIGARTAFVNALCALKPDLTQTGASSPVLERKRPAVCLAAPEGAPKSRLKRPLSKTVTHDEDDIVFYDSDNEKSTIFPKVVPSIAIQNKYLPEGLYKPQNTFPRHGLRDTSWLYTPFITFERVQAAQADVTISQFHLNLGDMQATYYTSNSVDWNCPNIRRTFVMAGRKENALVPSEETGGRIILVVPKGDEDKKAEWVAPMRDILVIEKLTAKIEGFEKEQDLGLLCVRRLAVYLFMKNLGLSHLMMLDDNLNNVYLSDVFSHGVRGWKAIYDLFQKASKEQGVHHLSASTYQPHRDSAPSAQELLIDRPKFNSKIVFLDVKKILSLISDPKDLLPVHLKYWGEDYFRQFVLHFAGAEVGVFDPSLIIIRRSNKHVSLSKKSIYTADCWIKDQRNTKNRPFYVQKAYQRMKDEVARNLSKCSTIQDEPQSDEDRAFAHSLEKQVAAQDVEDAFMVYDAYQKELIGDTAKDLKDDAVQYFHFDEDFNAEQGEDIFSGVQADSAVPLFELLAKKTTKEMAPAPLPPIESKVIVGSADAEVSCVVEEMRFPERNSNYEIVVAVQKRYFEPIFDSHKVLHQRWEILFFINFMKGKKVESMYPVHYLLDKDTLKTAPLKLSEKQKFNDPYLKAYVKEHLTAVRSYLGLATAEYRLHLFEPFPSELRASILDKAKFLASQGYRFLKLPDQKATTSKCSDLIESKSLYGGQTEASYPTVNYSTPSNKKPHQKNDAVHIGKLQAELSKPLKTHIIRFNLKLQALQERGYDFARDWNYGKQNLINLLAAQDLEDDVKVHELLKIFSQEGKSDRYRQEVQSLMPAGFQGTLMPYQVKGFLWGKTRIDQRKGVVLCDDMGLGKTIQTLAILAHSYSLPSTGPTLILCPASVVHYWKGEIAKFLPAKQSDAFIYTGAPAEREGIKITNESIVISTYETFRIDSALLTNEHIKSATDKIILLGADQIEHLLDALVKIKWIDEHRRPVNRPQAQDINKLDLKSLNIDLVKEKTDEFKKAIYNLQQTLYSNCQSKPLAKVNHWHAVILDEAHHIKNCKSIAAQILFSLQVRYKIILTGTPVQNTFCDLLPIMNFAIPGFFLSEGEIKSKFFKPIKDASEAIESLAKSKKRVISISDEALMRIPEVIYAKSQMEKFRALLAPFLLRRRKDQPEILAEINRFRDVPVGELNKEDLILEYHLSPEQHLLVEHVFKANKSKIMKHMEKMLHLFTATSSQGRKGFSSFTKLQQLQQLCTDPQMLSKKAAQGYLKVLTDPEEGKDVEKRDQLITVFQKLLYGPETIPSGKVEACIDFVTKKLHEDPANRALIFIWFVETTEILKKKFQEVGHDVHIITGATSAEKRAEIVKKFNGLVSTDELKAISGNNFEMVWNYLQKEKILDAAGTLLIKNAQELRLELENPLHDALRRLLLQSLKPIIILNIRAGGEGMNLQEGNIVIDLDSWWNPAAMDQALGRSYRIGQNRKVQHYIMSSPEVHIDQLIFENLRQKRILQKILETNDITDCLKTLRNYIIQSLQRKGFELVQEQHLVLEPLSHPDSSIIERSALAGEPLAAKSPGYLQVPELAAASSSSASYFAAPPLPKLILKRPNLALASNGAQTNPCELASSYPVPPPALPMPFLETTKTPVMASSSSQPYSYPAPPPALPMPFLGNGYTLTTAPAPTLPKLFLGNADAFSIASRSNTVAQQVKYNFAAEAFIDRWSRNISLLDDIT